MKRPVRAAVVGAALAALGACVSPPERAAEPSDRYTISLARPNQPLSGGLVQGLVAGRSPRSVEVQRVLAANPGLEEALLRRGVDLSRVTGLRVGTDNVVEVFTRAYEDD